jgi:AraC family transcriptional regulator
MINSEMTNIQMNHDEMNTAGLTDAARRAGRLHRAEYARRMNRVLNYIDTHLDQPLDLAQLAGVANFSPFHFHRVFAAWMGETLGDYARRQRLEKAAFRLSCGQPESVLETALATGFGSGEAFARAFKLKFGQTPSEWRRNTRQRLAAQALGLGVGALAESNLDQVLGKFDQAPQRGVGDDDSSHNHPGDFHMNVDVMKVNIIDLPAARVAYHRLIGPYGPDIGVFWRTTVAPWIRSHGLAEQTCYGVGHDDPSITAPDKCRYDACVSVPDAFDGSGTADLTTLPGGRYAVARFQGEPADLASAWIWLTRNWLPESGLQPDDRPCFEMFRPEMVITQRSAPMACDLCIPVRPL